MASSFPQPEETFFNKPVRIDLSNVPFGREMSFYIDTRISQPRKYLNNFSGIGKTIHPTENARAVKITIPLKYQNYGKFSTEIYSYFDDGTGIRDGSLAPQFLQCVNAVGRGRASYAGNFKGPYINGYRNNGWIDLGNNTFTFNSLKQTTVDDDLVDLDREFLRKRNSNFIYYMIQETDFIWFYNDIDSSIKPMTWLANSWTGGVWESQIIPAKGTKPEIKPLGFTEFKVKNLNTFWSAFSLVRRYVSWAYFMIQNVENVNLSRGFPVSIGDDVYVMLDLEHFYNGWWNGPPELGFGNAPGKPRFFDTTTEEGKIAESAYIDSLAQVLAHAKQILLNPRDYISQFINLEGIPEFVLEFWTDTPTKTFVGQSTPTISEFVNLWTEYIEMLPYKYRFNFKLGCYSIPDVYEMDFDNSKDGNISGGWYGEELVPTPGSRSGVGKVWNFLTQASRDKLNDLYIEKYKRLLDFCDFLCPQVYIYEPTNQFCDFTGGTNPDIQWDFYLKQAGNRNQFEQFTYDNVRRAHLYNKKYGFNKPILPILASVYPSSWEFTNLYNTYAKRGPYNKQRHAIPGNNDFITDRFIDLDTLKSQLKTCYDAVDNPSYIKGFFWWNTGIPRLVDNSGDLNPFIDADPFSTADLSGADESRRRRRVYSLDVDPTTQNSIEDLVDTGLSFDERGNYKWTHLSPWSNVNYKKHKTKVVRKELDLFEKLNGSVLQTNRIGTIPTEQDRILIINLSNLVFARETNFKSDNSSTIVHPKVYSVTGELNSKTEYETTYGKFSLHASSPNYSGYFYSWMPEKSPKTGQKIYNPNLLSLDRQYLNSKQNNIIYCMIGDADQEIAYNDVTGIKIGDIKNLTPQQLKNLNPFWSAFLIARRYVNWCYEVITKIESKNTVTSGNSPKSIGDVIYFVLAHEKLFQQWWSRVPKTEEIVYSEVLAEILDVIRGLLTTPTGVIGLNVPIPSNIKEKYMSHPSKTDFNFIAEWEKIIEPLPAKYKNVKLGIYNILDVSPIDTDGNPNTITAGFDGEKYTLPGNPIGSTGPWNSLTPKAREIINTALVNKNAVLLDKVDFLIPKVYPFEPNSHPLSCTKIYSFYEKNQWSGLDLIEQYTQDSVIRAALYNKLYNKTLPIFPMLNTAYEYDSNGSLYTTYCGNSGYAFGGAWYHTSSLGFPNRDQYIWGRRIEFDMLQAHIKTCYDAIFNDPTQIKGFFWWNNAIQKAVSLSNNSDVYVWTADVDSPTSYYRYRRYYADDYAWNSTTRQYTIGVWDEAAWGLSLADDKKIVVVTKDIQTVNSVRDMQIVYSTGSADIQL